MENIIENMKLSAGAMAEMVRVFYDSLIEQNFTQEQAMRLTSDYLKAVFGK